MLESTFELRRPFEGEHVTWQESVHQVAVAQYWDGRWHFKIACLDWGWCDWSVSGLRKTLQSVNCVICLAVEPRT